MVTAPQRVLERLASLPGLQVAANAPLAAYTRFGIGGPAAVVAETADEAAFLSALRETRASGMPHVIIGGGTNLIVSDEGYEGVVLKFDGRALCSEPGPDGTVRVVAQAGAVLQSLVDFSIDLGLEGLHTMTGIPGFTGAAVYGNAGAYGHSVMEFVETVRFFDGNAIREFNNAQCEFRYRESIFKSHKDWVILSVSLLMRHGDAAQLRGAADKILAVRNQKYPPTMKCAGSIFKNYLLRELPPAVAASVPATSVIEGKVPSAWFLEQIGAKGMKAGDIHVADYHSNLIYNVGNGTARELLSIIHELKRRVRERWDIPLDEEVQYIGFA